MWFQLQDILEKAKPQRLRKDGRCQGWGRTGGQVGEAVPRDTVLRAHAHQGPRMPSATCETRVSCECAFLVLRPSCRRGDVAAHTGGVRVRSRAGLCLGRRQPVELFILLLNLSINLELL